MYLRSLQLTEFRNYESLSLEFDPEQVQVIFGDNAQGKTNLLEAVHYLARLRTFRGSSSRDLMRFEGSATTRVYGEVVREEGVDELAVSISGETRKLSVNDKEPHSVGDYLTKLSVVRFIPDDILLLKGPGTPRRKMLDRAVFNLQSAHLQRLQGYNKALAQKNKLLRVGVTDPEHLAAWNERMATLGAEVVAARLWYIDRIKDLVSEFFGEISGSNVAARLGYRTGLGDTDGLPREAGELSQVFWSALERTRGEEARRGFAVVGPHRDDLTLKVSEKALKRFGSQGQHRMFALALKVAEIVLHHRERGDYPVLLLDDVRSELDADRVRYLFGFLNKIAAQIFVTSTDFRELSGELERPLRSLRIIAGIATEESA